MPRIDRLLEYLRRKGGSDLHLCAGLEPRIRSDGELRPIEGAKLLDDAGLRRVLREVASKGQWAEFQRCGDLDFAYGVEGLARFRANYFVQEHGAAAVFRLIPERIRRLDELGLPPVVERFAHLNQGLVLVTGPTGSGKSTTLAAIIDRINESYAKHIVTVEDPVEFVHDNKRSVVSHREIGTHAHDFPEALRAAVRQDANVLVVGEMRDLETIAQALRAAEMGLLVFGTLHTNCAPKAVDRLIDAFPADEQAQTRIALAETLSGIVAQLLLRTVDVAGRCAAIEVLLRTPALPNLIREGKTYMLPGLIQAGHGIGMQTMDEALMALLQAGRISPRDAHRRATDKVAFERLLP